MNIFATDARPSPVKKGALSGKGREREMDVVAGGQASRLLTAGKPLSSAPSGIKPLVRGSVRCSLRTAVSRESRRVSSRSRGSCGISARVSYGSVSSGDRFSSFPDDGHLLYYESRRPFVRAENSKERGSERKKKTKNADKEGKRRMKLVRGLADDLRAFSTMSVAIREGEDEDSVREIRAKIMSETAQALLVQLEALSAEMEMTRKRKEERAETGKSHATMKNERMRTYEEVETSTSSCSSESSSDSECDEVVNMKDLLAAETEQQRPELDGSEEQQTLLQGGENRTMAPTNHPVELSMVRVQGHVEPPPSTAVAEEAEASEKKKVEVCMGGKCKKSGAARLVEAFERALGADGDVSVCKCLGRCRDGPNVRVLTTTTATDTAGEAGVAEVLPLPPICVGVGLEDIQVIVAHYFGDKAPGILAV